MILNSSSKTDIRNYEKITNFYTLDFSLLMESDVLCFVLYVLALNTSRKQTISVGYCHTTDTDFIPQDF